MNRLLLILLFMSFSALSYAEKLDTVVYRIIYNSDMKSHKESIMYHETAHLDIGENVTYFYSLQFSNYMDAMNRIGRSSTKIGSNPGWGDLPGLSFYLYRNYPSKGKSTYCHYIHEPRIFYYEEDIPQIDWHLVPGDTTLLGYQCQKATCKFRGRDWTVYYTMDIPISEGPWKLCGLPGLVMYAADSKGDFTFTCIGIESPNEAEIVVDKSKWQKVEKKKLNKMLIEYYDDTLAWAFKVNGVAELIGSTKRTGFLEPSNLIPCLIETFK